MQKEQKSTIVAAFWLQAYFLTKHGVGGDFYGIKIY